jgi:succinate-acetate transporter protein
MQLQNIILMVLILWVGIYSLHTTGSSSVNSILIGADGVTTVVCSFNGIYNAATEVYNHNTVQNATLFGTGASVYAGFRMLDQWNNKYYR